MDVIHLLDITLVSLVLAKQGFSSLIDIERIILSFLAINTKCWKQVFSVRFRSSNAFMLPAAFFFALLLIHVLSFLSKRFLKIKLTRKLHISSCDPISVFTWTVLFSNHLFGLWPGYVHLSNSIYISENLSVHLCDFAKV